MHVMPPPTTEETMTEALKAFGWTCSPAFWARYYRDSWVFNLANAVERLTAERDALAARLQRQDGAQ